MRSQDDLESRYGKIAVMGQTCLQLQFLHQHETGAVNKGKALIQMLGEKQLGLPKSFRIYELKLQGSALFDYFEKFPAQMSSPPGLQERTGLANNCVAGYEQISLGPYDCYSFLVPLIIFGEQ